MLYFDDEPLEKILYKADAPGPTPADKFYLVKQYMKAVREIHEQGNTIELVSVLTDMANSNIFLYDSISDELLTILDSLIPQVPSSLLEYEPFRLIPLLQSIWNYTTSSKNIELRIKAGEPLYRCYEHQQNYANAKEILVELINITAQTDNKRRLAVFQNNLAFEYFFEKDWDQAIPLFRKAATSFKLIDDDFNYANSEANYLICLMEQSGIEVLLNYDGDLVELTNTMLSGEKSWHIRKPLILLAKLKEYKNQLADAISYTEQAILVTEPYNVKWTKIDQCYLDDLRNKL